VVINWKPFAKFWGDRGISIALLEAMSNNHFAGISLGPNCPSIHSLLFVDDLLVCGQATEKEASRMKQVLQDFCNQSGQTPNSLTWCGSSCFSPSVGKKRARKRESGNDAGACGR
jgi:hypothetical protein